MKVCIKPHHELTICEDGSVHLCCHTSRSVRNIKSQKLEDIWQSETMTSLRELNAQGKLPCIGDCKRKHNFFDPSTELELRTPNLERVLIIVGIYCNIRCVMCYQNSKRERCGNSPSQALSADLLVEQIDFGSLSDVVLQGGEPTVIPEAMKLFYYISNMKPPPHVNLITNGLVLSESMIDAVVGHSRFYEVSLNAATKETHESVNRGSCWERVMFNLRRLREERDRRNSKLSVVGNMTIIPQNILEIGNFIRLRNELGFDEITFNYDKKTVPGLLSDENLKKQIIRDIATALTHEESVACIGDHKLRQLGLLS